MLRFHVVGELVGVHLVEELLATRLLLRLLRLLKRRKVPVFFLQLSSASHLLQLLTVQVAHVVVRRVCLVHSSLVVFKTCLLCGAQRIVAVLSLREAHLLLKLSIVRLLLEGRLTLLLDDLLPDLLSHGTLLSKIVVGTLLLVEHGVVGLPLVFQLLLELPTFSSGSLILEIGAVHILQVLVARRILRLHGTVHLVLVLNDGAPLVVHQVLLLDR